MFYYQSDDDTTAIEDIYLEFKDGKVINEYYSINKLTLFMVELEYSVNEDNVSFISAVLIFCIFISASFIFRLCEM